MRFNVVGTWSNGGLTLTQHDVHATTEDEAIAKFRKKHGDDMCDRADRIYAYTVLPSSPGVP